MITLLLDEEAGGWRIVLLAAFLLGLQLVSLLSIICMSLLSSCWSSPSCHQSPPAAISSFVFHHSCSSIVHHLLSFGHHLLLLLFIIAHLLFIILCFSSSACHVHGLVVPLLLSVPASSSTSS